MSKYLWDRGRIRSQEASFNLEMGGNPDPAHAQPCIHGWYRERKLGAVRESVCVKCSKPEADCTREMEAREARAAAPTAPCEFCGVLPAFGHNMDCIILLEEHI